MPDADAYYARGLLMLTRFTMLFYMIVPFRLFAAGVR